MVYSLSDSSKPDQINILLAEYQACHMNRDHYDSLRWTIGSIFIGTMFALYGISFLEPLISSLKNVLAISAFSLMIFTIWIFYHRYVGKFVNFSIERAKKIEEKLVFSGYEIGLHTDITAGTKKGHGKIIVRILCVVVFLVWIIRIYLTIF